MQRVDHNWIHTRGGDGADLATKKILIIGCGSLGGYVAHLLARAGVGELMLLDNDKFEWENVGRHVLGASQIGLSKADALRKKIQQELPHLCVNHFFGDWRNWIDQGNTENFDSFDLVISTVGDWSCERPLNILRKRKNSPPLLFGWIEPYGVAGHALLAGQSGGCMECGVNQYGHFSNKVAAFEKGTLTKEPGGCTYYQEYGPLSVTPIAEMVSRLSIDVMRGHSNSSELRSWIGPISEIINHGGVISEFWENKVSNDSLSQTLGMSWINRENCNVCS